MTSSSGTKTVVPDWYRDPNLYGETAIQVVLGPHGSRESFTNKRNLRLASYFFPATTAAQAVVILVHGHGCSLLHEFLYHQAPGQPHVYQDSLVQQLNARGISVAGIDLQGCGFSEGLRCYIDRYEDYVEDVKDFIRSIQNRTDFAGLPLFLIGESLGGCISVHVCKELSEAKGTVLLAPMLSLERVSKAGLNPYLRPLSGLASRWFPTLQVAKTEKNVLYPDIQAYFDQDPQNWSGWTRARNAYEYLRVTEDLCANGMADVTFPFLILHGLEDTMTDPSASSRLHKMAQSTDKTLLLLPKQWHVILKEADHQKAIREVVDWISRRVDQSSALNTAT